MRPFDCYRAWLRTDRTRIDIQASGPTAAATQPLAANTRGGTGVTPLLGTKHAPVPGGFDSGRETTTAGRPNRDL